MGPPELGTGPLKAEPLEPAEGWGTLRQPPGDSADPLEQGGASLLCAVSRGTRWGSRSGPTASRREGGQEGAVVSSVPGQAD